MEIATSDKHATATATGRAGPSCSGYGSRGNRQRDDRDDQVSEDEVVSLAAKKEIADERQGERRSHGDEAERERDERTISLPPLGPREEADEDDHRHRGDDQANVRDRIHTYDELVQQVCGSPAETGRVRDPADSRVLEVVSLIRSERS
jgi:hypothetical protein